MLTKHFRCADFIFQINSSAIETLAIGPMVAFGSLDIHFLSFFVFVFVRADRDAVKTLSAWRVITLRSNVTVSAS